MRLASVLSVLASQAFFAAAYQASDELGDGIFAHYIDENGEEQADRLHPAMAPRDAVQGVPQSDGVYTYNIDGRGAEQAQVAAQPLGAHSAKFARGVLSARSNIPTLGVDQVGGIVDANDLNQAVAQLGGQCDKHDTKGAMGKTPWIQGRRAFSAVSGDVRVFVCNYDNSAQNCASAELNYSMDQLNQTYGSAVAGWAWFKDWHKSYGSTNVGSEFCTGEAQGINATN